MAAPGVDQAPDAENTQHGTIRLVEPADAAGADGAGLDRPGDPDPGGARAVQRLAAACGTWWATPSSQIEGVMVVRENMPSPVFSNLPADLAEQLRRIPGVRAVAPEFWDIAAQRSRASGLMLNPRNLAQESRWPK